MSRHLAVTGRIILSTDHSSEGTVYHPQRTATMQVNVIGSAECGKTTLIGQMVRESGMVWSSTDGGGRVVVQLKCAQIYQIQPCRLCRSF
jgi:predicted GTPase